MLTPGEGINTSRLTDNIFLTLNEHLIAHSVRQISLFRQR
jgi:hypothetical protein